MSTEAAGKAHGPARRTSLYAAHRRLRARMVDFAGWEMPVSYSGILDEHRSVRTAAGLFDVSHMGEVELRGPKAFAAVQAIVTNDAARLTDGKAMYSVVCMPSGGIVDDVIVTRLAEDRYFICVNAGNREKDIEWIREHAAGAEVVDRSDELALLALQGPSAAAIVAPLVDVDLAGLKSFTVAEAKLSGVPVMLSRTGYTGEDGFEIYLDAAVAEQTWNLLLEAGAAKGLVPAGLGARDTLRLEAGLALYGNDIDAQTTPLEAGLAWVVKFDKGDFVGKDALLRQRASGLPRRLVGLEMLDASIPRHGYPIRRDGRVIGTVTSGTKSPTLGRGIALGYVETSEADRDTEIEVEIRGAAHRARFTRPPFVRRGSSGGEKR